MCSRSVHNAHQRRISPKVIFWARVIPSPYPWPDASGSLPSPNALICRPGMEDRDAWRLAPQAPAGRQHGIGQSRSPNPRTGSRKCPRAGERAGLEVHAPGKRCRLSPTADVPSHTSGAASATRRLSIFLPPVAKIAVAGALHDGLCAREPHAGAKSLGKREVRAADKQESKLRLVQLLVELCVLASGDIDLVGIL